MIADDLWIAHAAIVLLFLCSGLLLALGLALLTLVPWYVAVAPAVLAFLAGQAVALALTAR